MRTRFLVSSVTCLCAVALSGLAATTPRLIAQQPPPPSAGPETGRGQATPAVQTPPGRGGQAPGGQRGGGRGLGGAPPAPDDTTGFTQIFDGTTLAGWDGDTKFWRAEGGAIVGQSTPDNKVTENTFLIWRGGTVRDFELKIEFRMNGTNSGVQYRSVEMPAVGKWVLSGYQADMDFVNQFTGNVHNERGPRFFLAQRGNVVRGVDAGVRKQVGTIGDGEALKGYININAWNQYHIIARGPVIMHLINGHLMSVFIDDDTTNRMAEGVLGLQMHVGEPFKVEYRNVWLKKIG
jgi:Domain of Unknown Function (DUF1080)